MKRFDGISKTLEINVSPDNIEEEELLERINNKFIYYNEFGRIFYLISDKDYRSICKVINKIKESE